MRDHISYYHEIRKERSSCIISLNLIPEPKYISIYRDTEDFLMTAGIKTQALIELYNDTHSNVKQIQFLEILVRDIFKDVLKGITSLKDYPKDNHEINSHEIIILDNLRFILTTTFDYIRKKFEKENERYFHNQVRIKKLQKSYTFGFDDLESEIIAKRDSYLEAKFTDLQIQDLEKSERIIEARESELNNIHTEFQNIHKTFAYIKDLVFEQGTVLDRVDHNITHAQEVVVKTNVVLVKTAEIQEDSNSMTVKCVCCLMILIFIMSIMLLIKFYLR